MNVRNCKEREHMGHNKDMHVLGRAVIIKEGQLLVNKNSKLSFFFLPGGHVDHSESVADAVVRELHEELGLQAHIERYLGCFEYSFIPHNATKCHTHEYNFIYQVKVPGLQAGVVPVSPEDHTVFAWVPLAHLAQIDFRPTLLKEPLMAWLEGKGSCGLVSSIER